MNDNSVCGIVERNKLTYRGVMMLVKTSTKQNNTQNVRYIQGFVNFNKVKLSVYCYEIDGGTH